MSRTSAAVKARYNNKAYDRIMLFIPKGKKDFIAERLNGESMNGYISRLIREDLGLTEEEWKKRDAE